LLKELEERGVSRNSNSNVDWCEAAERSRAGAKNNEFICSLQL